MKYHLMPFDSGPTTCAKFVEGRDPEMCPQVGTTRFGTVWVCRRFPSEDNSHTVLEEKDERLQRCPECLRAEKIQVMKLYTLPTSSKYPSPIRSHGSMSKRRP
jgi:hypothetical protein